MSWIGGDFVGLQTMGHALQQGPGLINPIVRDLTNGVDKLGSDASWSGTAAEEFRKLWSSDAVRAGGIGMIAGKAGESIAALGDGLGRLDADLYNAAHEAAARGAQIGSDGKPLPLVISGDASSPAAVAAMQAQRDYQATYAEAMHAAQGLRLTAAEELAGLMEPIESEDGRNLRPDEAVTIGDYLKAFYVVPNDRNAARSKSLPGDIAKARDEFKDLRKDMKSARADYAARGMKLPADDPARLAHSDAARDIHATESKLASATAGEGERPMSQLLNTKIADLEKLAPGSLKAVPKELSFLKDIPVVDVAASGAIAEFQAIDDHEKGWSETVAHTNDYAAAAGGLAAGAATVAAIAAAPVEVPAAAVAAVAGFAVVGVGGVGYEAFHEHWSEDIHDHGVVAGILHGTGNTFANTGGDLKDMGVSVGHSAKSLWKSVFG